jgi:hypothetical protein
MWRQTSVREIFRLINISPIEKDDHMVEIRPKFLILTVFIFKFLQKINFKNFFFKILVILQKSRCLSHELKANKISASWTYNFGKWHKVAIFSKVNCMLC